jgi:hypothetical protein
MGPKGGIWDIRYGTTRRDMGCGIWDQKAEYGMWDMGPKGGIWDMGQKAEYGILDMGYGTKRRDVGPKGIRDVGPKGIWDMGYGIWDQKADWAFAAGAWRAVIFANETNLRKEDETYCMSKDRKRSFETKSFPNVLFRKNVTQFGKSRREKRKVFVGNEYLSSGKIPYEASKFDFLFDL